MRKSDLKVKTEALIFAAPEQILRTNAVKCHIDRTFHYPLCKLCVGKNETVNCLIRGCNIMVQKEYKRRHDNITSRVVSKKLCGRHNLEREWYKHRPEGVIKKEPVKILWAMRYNEIVLLRPGNSSYRKETKRALIIDIALSGHMDNEKKSKIY